MEILFNRPAIKDIISFFERPLPIFQVLIGPRQVGKTTAAMQLIQKMGWPHHYATADSPQQLGPAWIEAQWRTATLKAAETNQPVLLILDELQKVQGWSEVIKSLWDAHKSTNKIKLLVLGSSALLLQKGLTESLAGRFFLHHFGHWSLEECRQAFGWNMNQWLYFGGYPGAAVFAQDERNWHRYITDSLIETVLAKDVMQMNAIHKPALLRQLFVLSASYPAQIVSYTKMLGQLQDAGNTTTLAHYLRLFEQAFLISGLENFSRGILRQRGSSPKLILWNNALVNALSSTPFERAIGDSARYGRLVENAVGAHLLNHLASIDWDVHYWRKGSEEVDFVVTQGQHIYVLEVKSGSSTRPYSFDAFKKLYPEAKTLRIGTGGIDLETFFTTRPDVLLKG